MPPPAVEIPQSLFTHVCPNCGYSLTGLPHGEACPECGRAPNPDELVLYGWGCGEHEHLVNARKSRIPWLVFWCVLGAAVSSAPWDPQFRRRFWHSPLPLAMTAILVAVVVYIRVRRRENSEYPGLIQVRLSPRGCVQYDDVAGPGTVRHLFLLYSWLMPIAFLVILLAIRGNGPFRLGEWLPISLSLGIITLAAGLYSFRMRKALACQRPGSMADLNAAYRPPVTWRAMRGYSLKEIGPDLQHLRIWTGGPMGKTCPVDAEIRYTPAQAQDLKRLIESYLALARPTQ